MHVRGLGFFASFAVIAGICCSCTEVIEMPDASSMDASQELDAGPADSGESAVLMPDSGVHGARSVTIVARDDELMPAEVFAEPGDLVVIKFENRGRVDHSLVIEGFDGPIVFNRVVPSGERQGFALMMPIGGGDFAFYCPLEDHRARGEAGVLHVGGVPLR
jgi:plastocyanin